MENLPIETKRLIEIIKKIGYGTITIRIRQGKPELVEAGIKQIKLDSPEEIKTGLESIDL